MIRRTIVQDGGGRFRFPASGVRTNSALWVPPDVNTLRLWLKPETVYGPLELAKDGLAIASIEDQSGQDNTATQTTAAKRPLWKANIAQSYPSIQADGVDDLLAVNSLATSFTGSDKALTLCACVKITGTDGAILSLSKSTEATNSIFLLGLSAGKVYVSRKDDVGVTISTGAGASSLGTALAIVTYNFTGTALTIRKNAAAAGVTALAMDVGTITLDRCTLMATAARGATAEASQLAGHLLELFVYAASLTTAQIDQAEAYLNRRYAAY